MNEPLDAPDGPGWWAFEGINKLVRRGNPQLQTLCYLYGDVKALKARQIDGSDYFVDNLDGKWYRLPLPWEAARE